MTATAFALVAWAVVIATLIGTPLWIGLRRKRS